ncbi:MAG: hypothetical protein WCT54_00120 [Patescibacteria group bacterium]|jgi:hypothetical protein
MQTVDSIKNHLEGMGISGFVLKQKTEDDIEVLDVAGRHVGGFDIFVRDGKRIVQGRINDFQNLGYGELKITPYDFEFAIGDFLTEN